MAYRRSIDFLPQFFKTETNSKFLNSTLDQLISEPEMYRLDGFVGRKFSPSYKSTDGYISEISSMRSNYQLEPTTIYRNDSGKIKFVSGYQDLLNRIKSYGGNVTDHNRLFTADQYSYDGLFDFDKFANFSNYYWLSNGPDPVDVYATEIPRVMEYSVTSPSQFSTIDGKFDDSGYDVTAFGVSKNTRSRQKADGYSFTEYEGLNPTIRLARGGTYTFKVEQVGHGFFIQTTPGLTTAGSYQKTLNIRDVHGVSNNGADVGTVTFTVPAFDAQSFYTEMPTNTSADLVAYSSRKNRRLRYIDIQSADYNDFISKFGGIDGDVSINGKTIIFLPDLALKSTPKPWSAYTQFSEGELIVYANETYRVLNNFKSERLFSVTNDIELFDAANDWYDPALYGDVFDTSNYDHGQTVPTENRIGTFKIEITDENLINLRSISVPATNTKIHITSGISFGSRFVYRNSNHELELIPNITANLDYLYYQDSLDSSVYGIIEIIDQDNDGALNVSDIVNKSNYTSPNGIKFINGLKVKFRGNTNPENYSGNEYYVEGVGTGIELVSVDDLKVADTWLDLQQESFDMLGFDTTPFDSETNSPITKDYIVIKRDSRDKNAWARTNRWFHESVISASAEYNNYYPSVDYSLRAKRPIIEFDKNLQLFNYGKNFIGSVDVIDFTTTDAMSNVEGKSVESMDTLGNISIDSYYINGIPLIDGSRVVFAADIDSAVRNKIYTVKWIKPLSDSDRRTTYFSSNGVTVSFDLNFSVSDPINLTVLIDGVNANSLGYIWSLVGDQTIVFNTAPADGRVITVTLQYKNQIHLVETISEISYGDTIMTLQGYSDTLNSKESQGQQFHFDGSTWIQSQKKTKTNQPPLYDVVDLTGKSYSDSSVYPSTNFTGNKIFGYEESSYSALDSELNMRLKYRNFSNIGDILFEDYLDKSTFTYRSNKKTIEQSTNIGRIVHNVTNSKVEYKNQWVKTEQSRQFQTETFFATAYQKNLFKLNVKPDAVNNSSSSLNMHVYVNNTAINDDEYDLEYEDDFTYLLFNSNLTLGDKVDVRIFSTTVNADSVFELPPNLEFNSLNDTVNEFTLGQLRDHISKVFENTPTIVGPLIGSNNSRNLGNIKSYGGKVIQNKGAVNYANLLLNDTHANFVDAVLYAQREYTRFKNKLMDLAYTHSLTDVRDPVRSLDELINEISYNKSDMFAFYASDMIPYGDDYNNITYTITDPDILVYDISNIIHFDEPSNVSVLVYKNDIQLLRGYDYEVSSTQPVLIFVEGVISVDDVISIREYKNTLGSHIPQTPTKMGLYPLYKPEYIIDGYADNTRTVLVGHDGSYTTVFGDHRDAILYEYECRVFNNIKTVYNSDMFDIVENIPGHFRNTSYSKSEYEAVLSSNFNKWMGKTGLKLSDGVTFDSNDPFTYNYSNTTCKLTGEKMPAANWRGIYNYVFDTDAPHLRPWEMLGFTIMPPWWEETYGPAPYTRGNLVLWEDIEAGYIAAGPRKGYDSKYARPNVCDYIPVDDSGVLLSPMESLVKDYNSLSMSGTYSFGDSGPVETVWRQSSEYPFSIQLALALMVPAKYFGSLIDTNDQIIESYGSNNDQWIYKSTGNRRNKAIMFHNELDSDDNLILKNSYISWITDYVKSYGMSATTAVGDKLRNISVNLSYKMAGYSDKRLLKIYADQASPSSTSNSVVVPDEDYDIVINKSAPTLSITYSGVIITKTTNGYTVTGYDDTKPYFIIEESLTSGSKSVLKVGTAQATKYNKGTGKYVYVPYGTEFTSVNQTVDFLISYGRYLSSMGFIFTDKIDEGTASYKDWDMSSKEYLYYVQQGWDENVAISLSPVGSKINFKASFGSVDGLTNKVNGTRVLTENFEIVRPENYSVNRLGREFSLTLHDESVGIYLIDIDVVNYEHVIVINNTTRFNDVIYDSTVGIRQYRLKLSGFKTGSWDGTFGAAGFIINEDNIEEWQPNTNYKKGIIVLFKNTYYSAIEDIAGEMSFDQTKWVKSDYTKINKGLLPNLANRAGQFTSYYDINAVNLESDVDRLGKGIIGLRPRSYFEDLKISDTSQTKFYQGMIKQKGTRNSLDKLLRAKIDNFDGTITYHEDWALRIGQYGAIDSRQEFQLIVPESKAIREPTVIQLIDDNDSYTDSIISYKKNDFRVKPKSFNTSVFAVRTENSTIFDLPSISMLQLSDVDYAASKIDSLSSELDATVIDDSSLISVAYDFDNSWNVYRVCRENYHMKSAAIASNGVATIEFDKQHYLTTGEVIMIKTSNNKPALSGFYVVSSIVNGTTITVDTSYGKLYTAAINGTVYKLMSLKYKTITDVDKEPMYGWADGDSLFVENATENGWGIFKKRSAIIESNAMFAHNQYSSNIEPSTVAGSNYGSAIAVNNNESYMFVSQPGNKSIICYKNISGVLTQDSLITAPSSSIVDFGHSMSASDTGICAVSAPTANSIGEVYIIKTSTDPTTPFSLSQGIVSPDLETSGKFGNVVSLSRDGYWLAVGQPDVDSGYVYVYQYQQLNLSRPVTQEFVANGVSTTITLTGMAANPSDITALSITIDGNLLIPYVDYTLSGDTITFISIPTASSLISVTVTRSKKEQKFNGNGTNTSFVLTGDNVDPEDIGVLTVKVESTVLMPYRDYTLSGSTVTLTEAPDSGSSIVISQNSYYRLVAAFSGSDSMNGDKFGNSLQFSNDGRKLIVGAPCATVSGKTNAGKVYVYDRTFITTLADGNTSEFTAFVQTPSTNVWVNDQLQIEETGYNDGTYSISVDGEISFISAPVVGSIITVENNYFNEVSILTAENPSVNSKFGYGIAHNNVSDTLYIGHPGDKKVSCYTSYGNDNVLTGTSQFVPVAASGYLVINNNWVPVSTSDSLDMIVVKINQLVFSIVATNVNNVLTLTNTTGGKINISATAIGILSSFGFEKYTHQQTIDGSAIDDNGEFGKLLYSLNDSNVLAIASDNGNTKVKTTFDSKSTTFDIMTTSISTVVQQSGSVALYQYIDNPTTGIGKYILSDRLSSGYLNSLDQFGSAVTASSSKLYIGVPCDDTYAMNVGLVLVYNITNLGASWYLEREQTPKVDNKMINSFKLIDIANNEVVSNLEIIDPFKGKIYSEADRLINYKTTYDPATYNVDSTGTNVTPSNMVWGRDKIGQIWWDTSKVKWMEYEQGSIDYRVSNWGSAYPNSSIVCYQWTESDVPPASYVDENNIYSFPMNTEGEYTYEETIDSNGFAVMKYYFWVGGKTSPISDDEHYSTVDIENLIVNPSAMGVSFVEVISSHAFALVNCKPHLRGTDIAISVDYDVKRNDDNIHSEYQMISEGLETSTPNDDIVVKIIDSIAGTDIYGRMVPDITLPAGLKYGKEFRPRQAMFKNRDNALRVAVEYTNSILKKFAVVSDRDVTSLFSPEPYPLLSSGEWDEMVENNIELSYINTRIMKIGHKVLVKDDDTVNRWTIYKLSSEREWELIRVQAYNNTEYVTLIDWVMEGQTVPTVCDYFLTANYKLAEIPTIEGTTVKVTSGSEYSIYKYYNEIWNLISLSNATFKIEDSIFDNAISHCGFDNGGFDLQLFDKWSNTEVQNIFTTIYNKVFTVEYEKNKNEFIFIMFKHLLQEQKYVDWLFKSSFITVEQSLGAIKQIPAYQKDLQNLIEEYITETKPYHTKIREFVIEYNGIESLNQSVTDFDVPAYYISESGRYRSPNGSETIDDFILDLDQYVPWRDNHTFEVEEIEVIRGGYGFFESFNVEVVGGGGSGVVAVADVIDGEIYRVRVLQPGSGFITTPTIKLPENNGKDALLAVRLNNNKIRKIQSTLKFDRVSSSNAGFIVTFKDSAGNPVDVRNERISRLLPESGMIDILMDIVSDGLWIASSTNLISYPVDVPFVDILNDASGRVIIKYQKEASGWTDITLQEHIRATNGGVNGLDVTGTTVVVDGNYVTYNTNTFTWAKNTYYDAGDIIVYDNVAYEAIENFTSTDAFNAEHLEKYDSANFESHIDRIMSYYSPKSGQLGKDIGQLLVGTEYPGVDLKGPDFSSDPGFDVAAYDIEPFDSYIIGPEGVAVLDPSVLDETIYSEFIDSELGSRIDDMIYVGGEFIDEYSGHATEEMMNGYISDVCDIQVYSSPSNDWDGLGSGLDIVLTSARVNSNTVFSFVKPIGMVDRVLVFSMKSGRLVEHTHFEIQRVAGTITLLTDLLEDDVLFMYAIDAGGNGLVYAGQELTNGVKTRWNIPVDRNLVNEVNVEIDGITVTDYTIGPDFTPGYATGASYIQFETAPEANKTISIHAFYSVSDNEEYTNIHTTYKVLTTANYPDDYTINLDNVIGYNALYADKVIVEVNGSRLQPPNCTYYVGDGTTTVYKVPTTLNIDYSTVLDASIRVAVDGLYKTQSIDWNMITVDSKPAVQFIHAPEENSDIAVSLVTNAGYSFIGNQTILIDSTVDLSPGDKISVLTFTNHDSIGMNTQVFSGTTEVTIIGDIGFDDKPYDIGGFDGIETTASEVTQYKMDRTPTKSAYMLVTLDAEGTGFGRYIYPNIDYTFEEGQILIGAGYSITADSIITITTFNEIKQTGGTGFRVTIENDGNIRYRRISDEYTTTLVSDITDIATEIPVVDASVLGEPNISANIPGVVHIGPERIEYYTRNLATNTLSQVRRGTSGTSAQNHIAGKNVVDSGLSQKIPNGKNGTWYTLGDGTPSNGHGLQRSDTIQANFINSTTATPPSIFV